MPSQDETKIKTFSGGANCFKAFSDWLFRVCNYLESIDITVPTTGGSSSATVPGLSTGIVTGDQAKGEREETIAAFKAGELRCLVNVRVLTTGFDVKDIDLIADLAPTKSPGLHVQKLGRGLRIHPNKTDCLLLDFAGNVLQHGPLHGLNERVVDRLNRAGMGGPGEAPAKKCPECDSVVAASARECPDCGYEFPIVETPRHSATAHAVDPMKESAQRSKNVDMSPRGTHEQTTQVGGFKVRAVSGDDSGRLRVKIKK